MKHDGTTVKVVSEVDFEFKGQKLPAMVDKDNEFWFLAKDVANLVEIKNYRDATRLLDNDEKAAVENFHVSYKGVKQKRKFTENTI